MRGIADTGFIVAFLNTDDQHNLWAVALGRRVSEPLLTCEAVLVEAAYLLKNSEPVLEALRKGLITLAFDLGKQREQLAALAASYADRQPDLCDLCVVRMSELFPEHQVITTDRRDFTVYRRNQRELIPLILPPE